MAKGVSEYHQGHIKPHSQTRREKLREEVYRAFSNGETYPNVWKKVKEDYWNVGWKPCRQSCWMILKEANEQIKEDWKAEREVLKGQMLNRFNNLYQESLEMGDRNVCLGILKEMSKMLGLYDQPIESVNLTQQNVTISFGFDNPSVELIDEGNNIQENQYS